MFELCGRYQVVHPNGKKESCDGRRQQTDDVSPFSLSAVVADSDEVCKAQNRQYESCGMLGSKGYGKERYRQDGQALNTRL